MAVKLPSLLSIGVAGRADKVIKGLKDFRKDDRPPIIPTFVSFHLMVALGMFFIGFGALGVLLMIRRRLFTFRPYLALAVVSIPLPFISNELGWVAAEIGRQPWVVQDILRTRDAVSPTVPATHVLASILLFSAIYLLLFCVWVFLLKKKVASGPEG